MKIEEIVKQIKKRISDLDKDLLKYHYEEDDIIRANIVASQIELEELLKFITPIPIQLTV